MANDLFYKSGSFNLICDVCGKKVKADEAKHRWDGLIVCKDDFELRHPLDFIKARVDKIIVPYARPRPPDVFVTVDYIIPNECTPVGRQGIAGLGIAGCAVAR